MSGNWQIIACWHRKCEHWTSAAAIFSQTCKRRKISTSQVFGKISTKREVGPKVSMKMPKICVKMPFWPIISTRYSKWSTGMFTTFCIFSILTLCWFFSGGAVGFSRLGRYNSIKDLWRTLLCSEMTIFSSIVLFCRDLIFRIV